MVTNVKMEQRVLSKGIFTSANAHLVSQEAAANQILTNAAVLRA
jgi:hypothetical protein